MNLKKTVIFSYAMVNLGILKITFNCFFLNTMYKAIQTRPQVLLVDSPYKSCIATHHEHVDVNVLDTSDTFFNVNHVIQDK